MTVKRALPWIVIGPFALWAAVRLSGLGMVYPVVQLLAFTPYVAAAALLPLLLAGLTRQLWPAVVAALVVPALAFCVLPGPSEGRRPTRPVVPSCAS